MCVCVCLVVWLTGSAVWLLANVRVWRAWRVSTGGSEHAHAHAPAHAGGTGRARSRARLCAHDDAYDSAVRAAACASPRMQCVFVVLHANVYVAT